MEDHSIGLVDAVVFVGEMILLGLPAAWGWRRFDRCAFDDDGRLGGHGSGVCDHRRRLGVVGASPSFAQSRTGSPLTASTIELPGHITVVDDLGWRSSVSA